MEIFDLIDDIIAALSVIYIVLRIITIIWSKAETIHNKAYHVAHLVYLTMDIVLLAGNVFSVIYVLAHDGPIILCIICTLSIMYFIDDIPKRYQDYLASRID